MCDKVNKEAVCLRVTRVVSEPVLWWCNSRCEVFAYVSEIFIKDIAKFLKFEL